MKALAVLALALTTPAPKDLEEVRGRWGTSVEVDVVQATCNDQNAMYLPGLQLVVMCRELEAVPVARRFILNHELAHAWMYQHSVPNSERGADELGMLMSKRDEVLAAADWMDALAASEPSDGDDGAHQAFTDRAASFRCLAYGLYLPEQTSATCRMYAGSVREQWRRVLELSR